MSIYTRNLKGAERLSSFFELQNEAKKRIFIVEGADGTGKTTICKILNAIYSYPILHLTYFPEQSDMELQYQTIYDIFTSLLSNADFTGLILDRFLTSNRIYSKVYQNSKEVGWRKALIDKINYLAQKDVEITYIYCIPGDKDRYLEHYKHLTENRKELYGSDLEKMGQVFDEYVKQLHIEQEEYSEYVKVVVYDLFADDNEIIDFKDILKLYRPSGVNPKQDGHNLDKLLSEHYDSDAAENFFNDFLY